MTTKSTSSLLLSNLFFTLLQPGMVAGVFPWFIARKTFSLRFHETFGVWQYIGIILFTLGFGMVLDCVRRFAIEGKGTLSPVHRTEEMVASGLYRYTRNPMYVGMMTVLMGESIFLQTKELLVYTILVFLAFYFFILAVEEPRLKRDFGEAYEKYCAKVRRWL